ncbi:polyamine transporter Tpo5 [Malassezia pachydermatis]|uniref:Apc amino acid permease n=1 Tax=Malassezia pachydermatis TaxID=77020 RepID=A0A0M8MMC0_9BASI|nr:apc amino acid permease [Malassezia pachydermatis]KOS13017.1 apc amino acid permease [Malassezia pachydermatis]
MFKGEPAKDEKIYDRGTEVTHKDVTDVNSTLDDDDAQLARRLGHRSEFAREFKSFSTISFAFAIMGLVSSIATTFSTPFLYGGGPASTVWAWFMGSCFNMTLGTAIAELVSAYPSSGGLYSASGMLVPQKYRAPVAWCTGWLNLTGQIAGIAGTEYGLSQMIYAWAYVISDGNFIATRPMTVGLYFALLVIHGCINTLDSKTLAKMTGSYVVVNIGITFVIIIVLLATTPLHEMHGPSYTFGKLINNTGWTGQGGDALAFLFGLLSVQFVMTDYDATAHISEEVHRASIAAPVAIMVAVAGTGIVGWLLNIVLVITSGDVVNGDVDQMPAGLAMAEIMRMRMGKVGFLVVWPFVCLVAFFVVTTATQANARSFYAFSRDRGLPDRRFFSKIFKPTGTTANAVWLVIVLCMLLGCLGFISQTAINAIFALAALGMDISYLIPIVCRQIFQNHPEVLFEPGPFTLGKGLFGRIINSVAIFWTLFECTILSIPTVLPISAVNFNYSWVVMMGVLFIAVFYYLIHARNYYEGPRSTMTPDMLHKLGVVTLEEEKTLEHHPELEYTDLPGHEETEDPPIIPFTHNHDGHHGHESHPGSN